MTSFGSRPDVPWSSARSHESRPDGDTVERQHARRLYAELKRLTDFVYEDDNDVPADLMLLLRDCSYLAPQR